MIRIKGLAVRARLDYLEQRFGSKGQARVIEALTEAHRALVGEGILVSSWYPLSLSDDILGSAERLLGKGDGAICREIGRASARKGLSKERIVFAAKPKSSSEIGAKMAKSTELLWQTYYSTGVMRTSAVSEHETESELLGIPVQSPWMCHVLTGYIAAHIEVLGGLEVNVQHEQCRAAGQPACIWRATWKADTEDPA